MDIVLPLPFLAPLLFLLGIFAARSKISFRTIFVVALVCGLVGALLDYGSGLAYYNYGTLGALEIQLYTGILETIAVLFGYMVMRVKING